MSLAEAARHTPPKLLFVNQVSGDEVEAQFNPTNFQEGIDVNWSKLGMPGNSHLNLQFIHTGNFTLNLELYFRALSPAELVQIHIARRRLLSWAYPRAFADTVVGGGAPRILVLWPQMLNLECALQSVRLDHQRFNKQGRSVQFAVTVVLEEIRNFRLTSEDVADDLALRFGIDTGFQEEGEG